MVEVTNTSAQGQSAPTGERAPVTVAEILPHWLNAQQTLASSTNLALVTVGLDNNPGKNTANETSICQSFLSDPSKAGKCAEFCGQARQRALASKRTIHFRCHANLHCFATPLPTAGPTAQVLIGGRTFLSVSEYREFLQRAAADNVQLPPQVFSNLKFTDEEDFDRNRQMILTTASEIFRAAFHPAPETTLPPAFESARSHQNSEAATAPLFQPQQLESFFKGSFEQVCRAALQLLGSQFQLSSGALLLRSGQQFAACAAGGALRDSLIGLSLPAESALLARVQQRRTETPSLSLPDNLLAEIQHFASCTQAEAFPLFIGEELTGLFLVIDTPLAATDKQRIRQLAQNLIVPLELARLRNTIDDQTRSLAQWQDFSHLLATDSNSAEVYSAIVEQVAVSLKANRVSLLVYEEESQNLVCKAASGWSPTAKPALQLGEGIAGAILERGEPMLVRDLREHSWVAARAHGKAHSYSFISYPLLSGSKRLGVINLTDRADEQGFTTADLEWLRLFAPYATAALEKIDLHERAQRFQLMAITDPLTGLLNRRYLEERFAQEIERSKRYQFPLSFVMVDIDGFKIFNDTFGHQAGDEVLRETAHCIRNSLRTFDVAARYGGEEFIIVLPETDVTSATALAERLRKAVEQYFMSGRANHPVTVSIGVSSLGPTLQNRQQVIYAADQALYAAKKRGKNCVVVYNTELVPGLT